ncbi:MAG: thioredoxin [Cyanobacteria bacterium P01_A01_bin.135]
MATKQTFTNFDEMIAAAELPVLVDFYATWCGPCQLIAPILEKVGAQLKGKLQVVKIDTDKYPELANQHNIHALPTLVLFKGGEAVKRIEGAITADKLVQALTPLL